MRRASFRSPAFCPAGRGISRAANAHWVARPSLGQPWAKSKGRSPQKLAARDELRFLPTLSTPPCSIVLSKPSGGQVKMQPLALIVLALTALFAGSALAQQSPESWRFAVSGDSRNCGDVVMPAIAQSVIQNQARFYWHLGDFRAMYGVDEDMQQRYSHQLPYPEYLQIAWTDFVESQIRPFAPVPVRLGIGNHEVMKNTPAEYLAHFGYWLDTPELR